MRKIWKLGELFCGPGGFAEGAQQAGFHHLWAVDHDPDSCISFGNINFLFIYIFFLVVEP